ncbi:MAG: hypothetical protein ACREJU_06150 [Nitrospiraceae bacterium]
MSQVKEGRTELRHDPEPGYGTIFYLVFGIAVVYLVVMLWGAF